MRETEEEDYGLRPIEAPETLPPPDIDSALPTPRRPQDIPIALIGAGNISEFHLRAYQSAGFAVKTIASRTLAKAEQRRDEFFPQAQATTHLDEVFSDPDVQIVDLTPHPAERLPLIEQALQAGKHVLSQKPLVTDLSEGRRLAQLAEEHHVHLAVNQNGRWAPHFRTLRAAIQSGLIGRVRSVDVQLQWDQTWVAGNPHFEAIHHLVLFDFGIHWFDICHCFLEGHSPQTLSAVTTQFPEQAFGPPALASTWIAYEDAQVRLCFNAHTQHGTEDVTTIVGERGTLRSRGPGLNDQSDIDLFLPEGQARIPLSGSWFEDGFTGAMGELLVALEERRVPDHSAHRVLPSLELCLAALESADHGGAPISLR
ncbi:MAG: Gfo/Idh/MocA family oxidoreductase [Verrucomicrobiota bacterium]